MFVGLYKASILIDRKLHYSLPSNIGYISGIHSAKHGDTANMKYLLYCSLAYLNGLSLIFIVAFEIVVTLSLTGLGTVTIHSFSKTPWTIFSLF